MTRASSTTRLDLFGAHESRGVATQPAVAARNMDLLARNSSLDGAVSTTRAAAGNGRQVA